MFNCFWCRAHQVGHCTGEFFREMYVSEVICLCSLQAVCGSHILDIAQVSKSGKALLLVDIVLVFHVCFDAGLRRGWTPQSDYQSELICISESLPSIGHYLLWLLSHIYTFWEHFSKNRNVIRAPWFMVFSVGLPVVYYIMCAAIGSLWHNLLSYHGCLLVL